MLRWDLSLGCRDASVVTAAVCCVQLCIELLYLHVSLCPSCLSLCYAVCLFALPNYPLGTIKIDWTELCRLWVTDRSSVAGVTRSHCMRTCRPSQLSVCLSVSLSLSNCLPPSHCSVVWVSLCRFSSRPVNVLLSLSVCLSTSVASASSSAHPSVRMAGFVHI